MAKNHSQTPRIVHVPATHAETATRLDMLRQEHGAPSAAMTTLLFKGYDAERGLLLGQRTATERILDTTTGFVRSVCSIWASLPEAKRRKVLGFAPAMLPVLLAEASTLRELNVRYDVASKRALVTRAQRESAAKTACRQGRELRDQLGATLRVYLGASTLASDGVSHALSSAETAEQLAHNLDALADYVARTLAAMDADTREACAMVQIDDALVDEIRTQAAEVRRTADDLNDDEDDRVTQRELDLQDGRALHVIGLIYWAFRNAARRDPTLLVPDLGELTSVFERADKPDKPASVPPPAPEPIAQPS